MPATRGLKRRKNRALAGKPSAAVGLNPHSGGPGEAGVGLGTRGRAGLRAFAGAVPQRELSRSARKAACFLFLFRCVWAGGGVTGGDLKPPQSEGTADTTRPAGACGPAGGFLRSSSSRRNLPPRPAFEAMTDVQLALAGDCVFTQGVGSGRAGQAAGARAGAVTCRRPGHRLQAQAGKGSGLCDSFTH